MAAPCLAAASAVLARARSSTRLASVWAWLFEYFCSEGFWWSIHSFHSRFEARRVAREAKPEPPGARVGACFAAASSALRAAALAAASSWTIHANTRITGWLYLQPRSRGHTRKRRRWWLHRAECTRGREVSHFARLYSGAGGGEAHVWNCKMSDW